MKESGRDTAWTPAACLKIQEPVQDRTPGSDGTRRPGSVRLLLGLGVGGTAIIIGLGRSAGKGAGGTLFKNV